MIATIVTFFLDLGGYSGALAVALYSKWFYLCYYLQPTAVGPVVSMIIQVLWDVKDFLSILLIGVVAYTSAMLVLVKQTEEVEGFETIFFGLFTSFKALLFGDFDTETGVRAHVCVACRLDGGRELW